MIRVKLPLHLRRLANVDGNEVTIKVQGVVTQRSVLDALEAQYPVLHGTVRDRITKKRRSMVRLFACGQDLSNEDIDEPLPEAVATGDEPYMIVAAIAGG